jgi:hypothetical protein
MADLDKNINGEQVNRILWVDPNYSNNVMVNPEDLSIKVEFTTFRKKRSVIFSGQEINNTGDDSASVNFIQGSKISDAKQPSLSTRYTDAIELEIMNSQSTKLDDYESLGIESIDIEFNTAFQPMIKIKFIDVRGQAVLQQGNMSKYRMFFELPYPIYNLKVKGFYGKTVSYCLHMQRWNASFNSNTGNFEIQADFLGYTYAVLTDMLMGLVRAAVRTEKGQKKLENKRNEYGQNSDLVITIDDMLKRLIELNFSVKKISENDDSAAQLQSFDKVNEIINKIKSELNNLINSIESPYFIDNDNNYYICAPKTSKTNFDKAYKAYYETITPLITEINQFLDVDFTKLDKTALSKVVYIKNINKNKLNRDTIKISNELLKDGKPNGSQYYTNDESNTNIDNIIKVIGNVGGISSNIDFDIYNFKFIFTDLKNKEEKIKSSKDTNYENLTEEISNISQEVLGFDPSIRNIFRVLSINTEIFLEVLKEVSSEAEENEKRKEEFNKLRDSINIKKESKDIYPWPEYREKNANRPNDGFIESWLGKAPGIISSNINEVVFVEEMHQRLIDVAKFDKELDELSETLEAGLDIDSLAETVADPWFPISMADVPIDSRITENPYITALNSESGGEQNIESVQRLLLMRIFTLLGVSTFNNKLQSSSGSTLDLIATLEAENFLAACRKFGNTNGKLLLQNYLNISGDDIKKYTERVIDFGLIGSNKIKNPLGDNKQKKIMRPFGSFNDSLGDVNTLKSLNRKPENVYYKYVYIRDENTKAAYIPINKNFDGSAFYNGDKFKTISELKQLSNDTIFVSNPINSKLKNDKSTIFKDKDDGSLHVKLYDLDIYDDKFMTPTFGSDVIDNIKSVAESNPNELRLGTGQAYKSLIKEPNNPDEVLEGFTPYLSSYSTPEFSSLIFQKPTDGTNDFIGYMGEPVWNGQSEQVDSSLLAFYTQNDNRDSYILNGTYLTEFKGDKPNLIDGFRNFKINNTNTNKNFNNRLYNSLKNKTLLSENINNGTYVYLPYIEFGVNGEFSSTNLSLFGSYFYYSQKTDYAKALLFLHTIPWQGVKTFSDDINEFFMLDRRSDWGETEGGSFSTNSKVTRVLSIRSLFQAYGAFVHVPKAWALFIGGILWRLRTDNEIYYGDKNKTLINPEYTPKDYQYIYFSYEASFNETDVSPDNKRPWGMFFASEKIDDRASTVNKNYVNIDKTIRNLPKQVSDEFVNYFKTWVDSNDGFQFIKKELELVSNTTKLSNSYDSLKDKLEIIRFDSIPKNGIIPFSDLYQYFDESVVDNYQLIIPRHSDVNFSVVLKPKTEVMNSIVSLLKTPTIIQNVNPNIWNYNPFNEYDGKPGYNDNEAKKSGFEGKVGNIISPSKSIRVRGDKMKFFLDSFHKRLINRKEDFLSEKLLSDDDIINQEIFGTSDNKVIKLQIYRTLSSINDKWINGSKDSNVFAQCGGNNENTSHLSHAKKYRTTVDNISLIDTFRFVDRAFIDIGDEFFIDINKVNDLIKGKYNTSFFDVVNQILSDNNFNFIPLPNFINFNNVNELAEVFKPYSYNDPVTFDGTGPAFICCYVGQTSTNLDLGTESMYPDDGLSITFEDGALKLPEGVEDFSGQVNIANGDIGVPVFAVNYGQQNQNYFKNVKLDQREFAETMESLEIIEAISQTGDKSKPTFNGNNLFNIYQTRSYSAEIEMMGSAMIQPMMYFQLNNIPMFRGAYLIYKVNHSITPHNMVTSFKGNRVKKTKTPLLDKATMYMNLVNPSGKSAPISNRVPNSALPIVKTLIDNGISNGFIDFGKTYGQITTKKLTGNSDYTVPSNKYMITEATNALEVMIKDFISWMKENRYNKNSAGKYVEVSSLYRSYQEQENINSNIKAKAGTSYHGWGLAVDMFWVKNKEGKMTEFNSRGSTKSDFDLTNAEATKWLYNNSYKYGFINPSWARDGSGYDELWHWEYHGKSAMCLVRKSPKVVPAGYEIPIKGDDTYNPIVKNPKTQNGVEDEYSQTSCDSVKIKMADGTNRGSGCPSINFKVKDTTKKVTPSQAFKIAQEIFPELTKKALSGMMGHLRYEGQFNPTAYNSDGGGCGALGIAQWRGNRLKNLEELAKKEGVGIDDFKIQIKFIREELNNSYSNVFNLLKNNNLTLIQYTAIFHISYGLGSSNPNTYYNLITDESSYLKVYKEKGGETPKTIPKRYEYAQEFFNT